jgi:ParB-like chromosome segregation protein Spo0J
MVWVPRIKLSLLRLDFQQPECLIEEVVQEKLQRIADGQTLEPITVRFDGDSYFVQDGFHRVEAAHRYGLSEIDAEVLRGTPQDMEADFREMLGKLKANLCENKQ